MEFVTVTTDKPDVIIFNDCVYGGSFLRSRTAGAYRTATHLRGLGLTVQVIEGWSLLCVEGIEAIIEVLDRFLSKNTMFVGFSATFFSTNAVDAYMPENDKQEEVSEHLQKSNRRLIHVRGQNPLYTDYDIMEAVRKHIKSVSTADIVIGGAVSKWNDKGFSDYRFIGYSEKHLEDYVKYKQGKNPFWLTDQYHKTRVVANNTKADGFDFAQSVIHWGSEDAVQLNEVLPIEVSRGCIFRCKFCAFQLNGKSKTDYIKEATVLHNELLRNYSEFGTTTYILSDDTFNDSTFKLQYLLDVFQKLPFRLRFVSYLRADLLVAHKEQIKLLHELGLSSALFGIESLNQASVTAIGKGGKIERIIETLHEARSVWKTDVYTASGFILGLPHDTYATMEKWVERLISPTFPLHDFILTTLNVKNMAARDPDIAKYDQVSEFDKSPEKFGYVFEGNGSLWRNDLYGTSFKGCSAMEQEMVAYLKNTARMLGTSFAIPELNNLGYTNAQVIGLKTQLPTELLRHEMYRSYQTYLKDIIKNDKYSVAKA